MNPFIAVNILIAVGAIIMVLGFLGCCGAMKESRCMLLLVGSRPIPASTLQTPGVVCNRDRSKDLPSKLDETLIYSREFEYGRYYGLGFGSPRFKFEGILRFTVEKKIHLNQSCLHSFGNFIQTT